MKATIKAPVDVRTRIGQIIGSSMYIEASGKELPEEFVILFTDQGGTKHGIRPAQDYQDALRIVKDFNVKYKITDDEEIQK